MSLPKFTAEASLYTISGHYQVDRRVINSYRRTINAVHPARDEIIGHEVIVIEDEAPDRPGFPWGWGGGGHGGGDGGGHGGGDGGEGRVTRPAPRPRPDETKRVPRPCGPNEVKEQSEWYKEANDCLEFVTVDSGKQQECLRFHGCPDDSRFTPLSGKCGELCPRSKFFDPLSLALKRNLEGCIKNANDSLLAKAKCFIPKADQDAFLNDWKNTRIRIHSSPSTHVALRGTTQPRQPRYDSGSPGTRRVEQ